MMPQGNPFFVGENIFFPPQNKIIHTGSCYDREVSALEQRSRHFQMKIFAHYVMRLVKTRFVDALILRLLYYENRQTTLTAEKLHSGARTDRKQCSIRGNEMSAVDLERRVVI